METLRSCLLPFMNGTYKPIGKVTSNHVPLTQYIVRNYEELLANGNEGGTINLVELKIRGDELLLIRIYHGPWLLHRAFPART